MSYIEPHMRESLKNYVLVPLQGGKDIQAFYLKKPGDGRMMSTLILFTPEGIVLQGDLTPGRNGNVSVLGYGVGWFASDLSEDYLCEKFLQKEFIADKAKRAIQESILERRKEGSIDREKARELWYETVKQWDHNLDDPHDAHAFWTECLEQDGADCPFYGYEPGEAGWLCAIQQRFATLYNEMKGSQ
jgi:hypothetical protein